MRLVERHLYKPTHKDYKELDNLCFMSKNLYNATLYAIRQHFFTTGKYLNYNAVNKTFTVLNQPDYRALPAKVSKHTQMLVDKNMKSFFQLKKKDSKAKVPKYLDKAKGRQVVHYEKGALSFAKKEGYINLSKTNIYIKTRQVKEDVEFVRVVPKGNHIAIEVGYSKEIKQIKPNIRYASIDLGVNNLMVVASNVMNPLIVNGKPVKSVNQYYNKKLAKLQSDLELRHNKYQSEKTKKLTFKRENKLNDYLHKATAYVVNQLVSNDISLLVIGYNKGWKQDITLGKKTNQKFTQIPFLKLVKMLKYKCELQGIQVVIQEESYTSKCSFLDNEPITKHKEYLGKRVKRGLFRSSKGIQINADLNGSLNILKKYLLTKEAWNESIFSDCVEVCSRPNLQRISF